MKRKNNPIYTYYNCCMLCANPYDKRDLIYIKGGMFHKNCLKRMIEYKYDNLTDDEIDFLIDTEVKEYNNYKKEKIKERCINNIIKIK